MARRANNRDGNLRLIADEFDRLRAERGLSSRQVDVLCCLVERVASDKEIRGVARALGAGPTRSAQVA